MPSTRTPRTHKDTASDVVVIGGGPAGLAAAHRLGAAGLAVTVLEAADRLGGRMATEQRDGFLLDRTSPLLPPGHPELARLPRPLPLRRLTGGVVLPGPHRLGDAPPHGRPGAAGPAPGLGRPERSPVASFDQIWLRANLARLGRLPDAGLAARGEDTAASALAARGIPPRIAEGWLRPLLAALLGDPELATSSRLSDAVLRAFARRGLGVPAGGAAALPGLLASVLGERVAVRTGVRAVSVTTTAVATDGHGTFRCRAVVLATGAEEAARLLPGMRVPEHRQATVMHHAAPAGAGAARAELLVDGGARGPVTHTLAASAVDPCRAPAGRTLVTSVVLGPQAAEPAELLDKAARAQLSGLYDAPAHDWELLAAYHDPRAVPVVPPPFSGARRTRLLHGLYVCGDHRDVPGPVGDLASARRAAADLLTDAGLGRAGEQALPADQRSAATLSR